MNFDCENLYFLTSVWSGFDSSLDSIAVSVFADIFIELTNIRQQDPNNYSDTVTRVLSTLVISSALPFSSAVFIQNMFWLIL